MKRDTTRNHPKGKKFFRFRLFVPILAGATVIDRLLACIGALAGIACTALISKWFMANAVGFPLIVAPLGASAVLLFVVPASPLAQPWPIIGGNTISAVVGVLVARIIPDQVLAVGFGVSLAILAMSFTKSLHPPGGATALTAIVGGPAITGAGLIFPIAPVGVTSVLLVILGIFFHRIFGRKYPHTYEAADTNRKTADPLPSARTGFQTEDIESALAVLDETLDITQSDLEVVLREVEYQASLRSHGHLRCSDIMSKDVVCVRAQDQVQHARRLLLIHDVRALPVIDNMGVVIGNVGLREIAGALEEDTVSARMSSAALSSTDAPAIALFPELTNGKAHAVMIVDDQKALIGIVTQTDLLAAVIKLLPVAA